jgi:hypothetical protein
MSSPRINALLLFAAFFGTQVQASPAAGPPLISAIPFNDGTISWYGKAPGQVESLTNTILNKRWGCGDNAPHDCDGNNEAKKDMCFVLLGYLEMEREQTVQEDPRHVCYEAHLSKCCTSWSRKVPGLTKGDLITGLQAGISQCGNDKTSARIHNVNLHGVCLIQCTSNRERGCN